MKSRSDQKLNELRQAVACATDSYITYAANLLEVIAMNPDDCTPTNPIVISLRSASEKLEFAQKNLKTAIAAYTAPSYDDN